MGATYSILKSWRKQIKSVSWVVTNQVEKRVKKLNDFVKILKSLGFKIGKVKPKKKNLLDWVSIF